MKNIQITRIILRSFKGFKTTNIEIADIRMVKKLQQLISTNGSGKSTFLSEFSLTPINKELFRKGGGKIIEFIVDGVAYIFKSDHSGHVLLNAETGEALTQGNTISHYNELVSTLFGYTDYKWKLITGQIRFTALSKLERQKWIESISGIDFTYPFKIYSAIKSELTGVKRAVKEYQAELANSNESALSDALRIEKTERRDHLNHVISEIIANKGSTPSGQELQAKMRTFADLDDKLAKRKQYIFTREPKCFSHLNVDSLDEFRASYIRDSSELDNLTMRFELKEKELREKVELRDKLSSNDKFDMAGAEAVYASKSAELEELSDLSLGLFNDSHVESLKLLAIAKDDIIQNVTMEIVGKISNVDGIELKINDDAISMARKSLDNSEKELSRVTYRITHIEEIIQTTKNGDDITCPKCNEIFKDGERNLPKLTEELDNLMVEKGLHNAAINKLKGILSTVEEVLASRNTLIRILRTHIQLNELNHRLVKMIESNSTIADVQARMAELLEEARTAYRMKILKIELETIGNKIKSQKELQKLGTAEQFEMQCDELEMELVKIRELRQLKEQAIARRVKDGKELSRYINELDEFEALITQHGEARDDIMNALFESANGQLLKDLQVEMGRISNELTNDEVTRAVRTKLTNMITRNRERLEVLVDLEQAVNPSTGIIAEQLTAYCKLFSGHSTQILSKIWGYDMHILEPIIHPSRGLNYRFPMSVKDDEQISDISCGSTSQKSIIDLAITLASRELLNASAQPIFLDEVGGGFDTIHNLSLGEFLYEFICTSKSKNIMVIHHDQSIRSSLGDCDTIVFDPSQVVVDEGYNENVKLKLGKAA